MTWLDYCDAGRRRQPAVAVQRAAARSSPSDRRRPRGNGHRDVGYFPRAGTRRRAAVRGAPDAAGSPRAVAGGGRGKSKEATRAREGAAATRTPPLRPHAAATGRLPGRLFIKYIVPTTY
ncbi:hypothetical protein RR46_14187 [Papilio xuthus]|uniref:Uncharacterized protein n=1 Tax=Papilio xuthus TaxID=66420 RepID=A0A194PHS2_PAPXU|nr:hypothetical protein RR46_14187 [Papilio xuthus]